MQLRLVCCVLGTPTSIFGLITENEVLTFLAWLLLFVFCWPLAILALVLWPLLWLISLPFRVLGITFDALFALLRTILFLPARALGYKPGN